MTIEQNRKGVMLQRKILRYIVKIVIKEFAILQSFLKKRKGVSKMPDKKLPDSEIIKALECCVKETHTCLECPYTEFGQCEFLVMKDALDLINRQKAEIERLQTAHFHAPCRVVQHHPRATKVAHRE